MWCYSTPYIHPLFRNDFSGNHILLRNGQTANILKVPFFRTTYEKSLISNFQNPYSHRLLCGLHYKHICHRLFITLFVRSTRTLNRIMCSTYNVNLIVFWETWQLTFDKSNNPTHRLIPRYNHLRWKAHL